MIALRGMLDITVNGTRGRLEADEKTISLDLDDPAAFLRDSQLFHKSSLNILRQLAEQLAQSGTTLTVLSRDKTLLVIGYQVKSGISSYLLGVPHLALNGAGLLRRITKSHEKTTHISNRI